MNSTKVLKVAMIGGASDSHIGPTHVAASQWHNQAKLVAGAFSRDLNKSISSGVAYDISKENCFTSIDELLKKDLDVVIIATPNSTHIPYAIKSLEAGLHVMCEKPLGITHNGIQKIKDLQKKNKKKFCLAHHNIGFLPIEEIRKITISKKMGAIQCMRGSYIQGWLNTSNNLSNNPQAKWRLDPNISGPSCCFADIGSHVVSLMQYCSNQAIIDFSGNLYNTNPDRELDEMCQFSIEFENNCIGLLTASQVSYGYQNDIDLHCDYEHGSLSWSRNEPNKLTIRHKDNSTVQNFKSDPLTSTQQELIELTPKQEENTRAFAKVYANFFDSITHPEQKEEYINLSQGIEVMKMIDPQ